MSQPKLQIEKDTTDRILELGALILLILSVLLPVYYYPELSESIPTHFGSQGKADGYGGKNMIWILVIGNVFIYILLTYLSRFPHHFNYPRKITEKNAKVEYTRALKMMLYLKVFILLSILYITWISIQNGLGNNMSLGTWFTPVFVISIIAISIWPFFKSKNEKAKQN